MYLRPNYMPHTSLTATQFIHEWVHHLADQGIDILDASRGKPTYPLQTQVRSAMIDLLTSQHGGKPVIPYGRSAQGEPIFCQKAAEGLNRLYGTSYDASHILFTPGGQFALAACFRYLESTTPGGVIVTPTPYYANHADLYSLFSHQNQLDVPPQKLKPFIPIDLLARPKGRITAQKVAHTMQQMAKTNAPISAFLFCNPGNPLGNVITRTEWKLLMPLFEAYPNVPIMLDEAFGEVIFDSVAGRFNHSLLHVAPHLQHRVILFRSGTKAIGFPGERLSLMAADPHIIQAILPLQSRLLGNASLTSQAGMAEAIASLNLDTCAHISDYYQQNAHLLVKGLKQLNSQTFFEPEGCFYLLLSLPECKGLPIPDAALPFMPNHPSGTIESDIDLALALLFGLGQPDGKGIGLIPGSFFGTDPKSLTMRLSFSINKDEIHELLLRIKQIYSYTYTYAHDSQLREYALAS